VQFVALPEYTVQTMDQYSDYPLLLASTADTGVTSGFGQNATSYFRDLSPLMEPDSNFNIADFWPTVVDACQDADGHVLGIPANVRIRGVHYDAQAFDSAGLPYPAPGWTWDDFRKDVGTLAKTEGERIRYGYAERFGTILSPLIEAVISENEGEIVPAALQPVVQWYLDFVKAKAIRPTPDYDVEQGQEDWNILFQSEDRPAMWGGYLGDTMPGSEFSAEMAYQEYGFAPYPVAAGSPNQSSTPVSVQCLAVSRGSQNPRAAWEWLDFLSHHWLVGDKDNPGAIAMVPGRSSVVEAEGFWEILPVQLQPTVRYILEQGGYVDALYADPVWTVSKALSKAAAGNVDFVTALEQAKEQLARSPSGPGNPVVVATPQPTLSADITAIDFLYNAFGEENRQVFKAMTEAYNKSHPDTRINLSTQFPVPEHGDYYQTLTSFDCFLSTPQDWTKGYFLPLDSFIESEDSSFLQDFAPALLDRFRYDGVLYGLPAFSQPTVMVYNADLLVKRGLETPSNDWTFNDYIELATKAASASESEKSYGILLGVGDPQLLLGRGVELGDTTTNPPVPPQFDSPEFASALAWIADLYEAGVLLDYSRVSEAELMQIDRSGQLAFWNTQVGYVGSFFTDKPNYRIGVLPMPTANDSEAMRTWSLDYGFIISSQAKDPELCWDWIKYLSEQPYYPMGVPARNVVAASAAWEAVVGKENAEVYRLALAKVEPSDRSHALIMIDVPLETWLAQAMAAALNGEDYLKLLPVLQTKADNYLTCIRSLDLVQLSDDDIRTAIYNCARQVDPEGIWEP
jgi:multiple sugar transport system substrate-binding protein